MANIVAVPTLGWPELLLVLAVLLLLFGARKLPEMARSLGRSTKEFKAGLKDGAVDDDDEAGSPGDPAEAEARPAEKRTE